MTNKCNSKTESFHKQKQKSGVWLQILQRQKQGKWRVEDYSKFCLQYLIKRQTKERPPKDPIWSKILEAIFSATRRLISPLINLLPQHFCHNQLYNTLFYHLQRSNDFCHIFYVFLQNIIPRYFYQYSKTGLSLTIISLSINIQTNEQIYDEKWKKTPCVKISVSALQFLMNIGSISEIGFGKSATWNQISMSLGGVKI